MSIKKFYKFCVFFLNNGLTFSFWRVLWIGRATIFEIFIKEWEREKERAREIVWEPLPYRFAYSGFFVLARFAGILEEYNSNHRAKRNVINKSKKMQGTNCFFPNRKLRRGSGGRTAGKKKERNAQIQSSTGNIHFSILSAWRPGLAESYNRLCKFYKSHSYF